MGSLLTLLMVCALVFFVIFAAKSKSHFDASDSLNETNEDKVQKKRNDQE